MQFISFFHLKKCWNIVGAVPKSGMSGLTRLEQLYSGVKAEYYFRMLK